jgi:translation initiation factor 1
MGEKKRGGIVYSTNPDFKVESDELEKTATLPENQQKLHLWLDSKGRKGKTITLIKGFVGDIEDLEKLAGELKKNCGTGGSVKDGDIIIQGDFREKIMGYLKMKGYQVIKSGR